MLWELLAGHAKCVETMPDDATIVYVGAGDPVARARIWCEVGGSERVGGVRMGNCLGRVGLTSQIMPGAVVMPRAVIGDNVLINTGAQVDHDCIVGAHSHIAPGAILCGNVTLGERSMIGAGATIVQGVTLDAGTFIPAGTLVCGQDDLRRPQRVLQRHGASFVDGGEGVLSSSDLWRMGRCDYSDFQSEASST